MVKVNGNYLKLKAGYLFPEIGRRVKAFSSANPGAQLIRLGIGDVTEPLPLACRNAMKSYKSLIDLGVARELARTVLPLRVDETTERPTFTTP
mgnify:CR=1 FL=1